MTALPRANYRKNPPGMLRHLGKVDLLKTLRYKLGTEGRDLFRRFPDTLPVSAPAADFVLQTVSGETVRLSDYRGKKHVVLEFGSFT